MGRQLRALALSPLVGQRLTMLGPKEHHTVLERLTELIEAGKLVPAIEQTLPAQRDAQRHATPRSRTSARQARHRRQLYVDHPRAAVFAPPGGCLVLNAVAVLL
jgi:hypothetical protein